MSKELTVRGIIIGLTGSVIVTASSMYVALRLGALPWPTIFVAVLSMFVLKALRNTTRKEINVTHTVMSAGAMVAGGLAFTIPALWVLDANAEFRLGELLVLTLAGTLLGLTATSVYRSYFIEIREKDYKYPIGLAAYETVMAGDSGGRQAAWLFSTMGVSALFTVLRDSLGKIPAVLSAKALASWNVSLNFWMSPMAAAIGYTIGPLYTGIWFLGAVLGFGIIVPGGMAIGIFSSVNDANALRSSVGLGLMVGTGLGIFGKGIVPRLGELIRGTFSNNKAFYRLFPLLTVILVIVALPLGGGFARLGWIWPPAVLILVVGTLLASILAAILTGKTGINPIETLAALVLLALKIIAPSQTTILIGAAAVTAVAVGLAGDMMNDYKAGHLFGTSVKSQRIAETAGALLGAIVSVLVLRLLIRAYGPESLGNPDVFPAPQARAVAALAGGIPYVWAFWISALVGAVIYVAGVPSTTLGLGVYLPTAITLPIFLGGMVSFVQKRLTGKPTGQRGTVIASGLLGGEAVMGVVLALIALSRV